MTLWNFIFRGAQRRNAEMLTVGSVNYCCAALACWIVVALQGHGGPSPMTTALAVMQGLIYVASFFCLIPSMNYKGISIVIAFTRLAVVVPVLASVLIWDEIPTAIQSIGAALAILSLPLLSLDKGVGDGRFSARQLWVFAGLFATNGLALVIAKWFNKQNMPAQTVQFLAVLFTTAAIGSFAPWLRQRLTVRPLELGWGAALGLSNAACNLLLLLALTALPGVVVFPVNACGGIVLTAVIAALLWREIPGRRGFAGIGLAAVALICININ